MTIIEVKDGSHVTEYRDGQFTVGVPGPQGPQGPAGATGAQGPQGAAGTGVPAGGATNQVLAKASPSDHDTIWTTPSGGSQNSPIIKAVTLGEAVNTTAQTDILTINFAAGEWQDGGGIVCRCDTEMLQYIGYDGLAGKVRFFWGSTQIGSGSMVPGSVNSVSTVYRRSVGFYAHREADNLFVAMNYGYSAHLMYYGNDSYGSNSGVRTSGLAFDAAAAFRVTIELTGASPNAWLRAKHAICTYYPVP